MNSDQSISRIFNSWSTANDVLRGLDLSGKVALITGSNSGIGLETAKSLAQHGCEIIFACRNRESTLRAIEEIRNEDKSRIFNLNFIAIDLASLASCREFCEQVKRQWDHIDFLILNAGVFGLPYILTTNGFEATFQICHLAHFFITLNLSECLNSSSRVVVVASSSHRFSNLPTHGLTRGMLSVRSAHYWQAHAYNNAKLLNTLFALELSRRWATRGIAVFAVHPGNLVWTSIHRNSWWCRLLFLAAFPFSKSLQQAAATSVFCATATELSGVSGKYFENCRESEPSAKAKSEKLASDLWKMSVTMIREKFGDF